jgi:hypothetical protein
MIDGRIKVSIDRFYPIRDGFFHMQDGFKVPDRPRRLRVPNDGFARLDAFFARPRITTHASTQ